MTRVALSEKIAPWCKNHGGEAVRVRLSAYGGRNLIDLRTWFTANSGLKPGKGFCADLLRSAAALTKAETKARELGLITADNDNGGAR
jgi:hypothetical protein